MEILGYIIAWVVTIILLCCYPVSEFGRGMATNPGMHKQSKVAMALSIIGLILIGMLIFG